MLSGVDLDAPRAPRNNGPFDIFDDIGIPISVLGEIPMAIMRAHPEVLERQYSEELAAAASESAEEDAKPN